MSSIGSREVEKEISAKELKVGQKLAWSLYDPNGALLLPQGTLINSAAQIERLLINQARRFVKIPHTANKSKQRKAKPPVTAITIVQILLDRLEEAFELIHDDKDRAFTRKIMQLVFDIQAVCTENADAVLGSMQLLPNTPHALAHPLHAALLCEVCYLRMGKDPLDRFPIVAAALTHDIGMYEVHQELTEQAKPLESDQQHIVRVHATRSYDLLKRKGITEERWLEPVLNHHERLDGSGYPNGIAGKELGAESRLLAIASCYSAMIRPRAYARRILPKEALKEIFQMRGNMFDGELARLFINVLGIFSPGCLVQMNNGAKAVVTGQTRDISEPKVALITCDAGELLRNPKEIYTDDHEIKVEGLLCPKENGKLLEEVGTIWPMMNPISDI